MLKYLSRMKGENSLTDATKVLVVTLFCSNILGVLRDHYLAQKIPTSLLDTYYAAFRLPDLVFNILILGAISAAFIPVFTELLAKDKKKAFRVANNLLNIGLVSVAVSLVLLFFLMPWLIKAIVPSFSPDKQATTLNLARLFLVSPLFFAVSYYFSGILNSFKHFTISSLAPLVYNLSIILGTIILGNRLGVYAPAIGVLVGSLLHMAIQLPSILKRGWRPSFTFDLKDKDATRIFKLMIPRSIGLGSNQILLIGFTAIASGLGAGSVAIYNLADNIQTMPSVVFGTSIASALFPHLSGVYAEKNERKFIKMMENGMLAIIYFLIPLSIAIILLRAQVVRIILGSGHFGWEQTQATASTLGIFSVALVFSGILPLFAKALYARQNTKTPTIMGVITVVASLAAGFFLSKKFGVAGLAAGLSLGMVINVLLLGFVIKRIGLDINWKKIGKNTVKILFASGLMAIYIQAAKYTYGTYIDLDRFVEVFGQIVFSGFFGILAFITFTKWLKVENFSFSIFEKVIKIDNGQKID
ncbi:murein biosynthesis integral membrane protein MurJ [Candidatus Berkelbacteria bacterium]|nr:murein biosynthesis integral membrane protein MurJ [Candidatus Berkelbacteria bacterium]